MADRLISVINHKLAILPNDFWARRPPSRRPPWTRDYDTATGWKVCHSESACHGEIMPGTPSLLMAASDDDDDGR